MNRARDCAGLHEIPLADAAAARQAIGHLARVLETRQMELALSMAKTTPDLLPGFLFMWPFYVSLSLAIRHPEYARALLQVLHATQEGCAWEVGMTADWITENFPVVVEAPVD